MKQSAKQSKRATSQPGHNGAHPEPAIRCSYTRLADPKTLNPNPANPNKHPDEQLALYGKVILHQGFRRAPVISKQSGFIVTGHGSVLTALRMGWTKIPIDEQDFATPGDETAHMLADNRLPELAELDAAQAKALLDGLEVSGLAFEITGFSEKDAEKLLAGLSLPEEAPDFSDRITEKFEVVVECGDEQLQQEIFTMLTETGYKCRLLTL